MASKTLSRLNKRQYAALVRHIWTRENVRCFDGRLRAMPNIKIYDDMDLGAFYLSVQAARGTLAINRAAACNGNVIYLRNTIIHEMIHQEQSQHASPIICAEHHGRFFRRRAAQIVYLIGYDVVGMYPMRGTPGFFFKHNPAEK